MFSQDGGLGASKDKYVILNKMRKRVESVKQLNFHDSALVLFMQRYE